ncbi:MAG: U32 family peptidase [Oscillospiraceae bacterium]|nr:U32 family peptidase [Oscillospiraceae bacterium]
MEALRAAVQNGADAVYLGYGQFHARVRAAGFSESEFRDAVRYCHLYGVRVYLTLNTLLTDRELFSALEQARVASRLGVDAVLVQDWGLFSLIRACLPDLPIHASTQMSAFTTGAVRLLHDAGCTRIVAARECSRDDVAALCRDGGAEIETFVHGALCMCYSGQCAMSAVIGGRSGNRGRCAQPCRLPCDCRPPLGGDVAARRQRGETTLSNANAPPQGGKYALSLKDLNMSAHLQELRELGVACLKIEGRLKRPEYVALVTSVYAKLLRERRGPSADETALLERAFSRSGFTDAYWNASPGPQMFGTRPANAPDAESLFREVRATYENDATRKIKVKFDCEIRPGEASRLTACDSNGHTVTVTGATPEAARTRPLTPERVAEQLRKTGGTAYLCDTVKADVGDGLSLSAGALNALRRAALDALSERRTAVPTRRECDTPPLSDTDFSADAPRYAVSVCRPQQLIPNLLELSPERFCFPLEWFLNGFAIPDWLRSADAELCAVLPRVWRDRDENALSDALQAAKRQGVTAALAGNIGHLPLIRKNGVRAYGDFGLNVTNARSAAWLAGQGLQSVCASFELRLEQIRDMKKPAPLEAIVYGRLPLMITENRPGGKRDGNHLIDRTGTAFPLLDAYGNRTEIENSRPVWLADRELWRTAGLRLARLRFTTESPDECADVVRGYLNRRPADGPFTRGLYERGVE